jgi:hypothetical protein
MTKIKKGALWMLVIVVLAAITYTGIGYILMDAQRVTVTKTERVSDQYLVFTDKGVFTNKDDWRFLKFNSSDLYGKLSQKIGSKVIIQYTGFRIPVFSVYPNIVAIQ